MRQTIVIILISIMISGNGFGQQNLEDNVVLREVFEDGEFFFANEDYADALLEYLKLYRRGFSENANINYKMGICYLNILGQKQEAIKYLQYASNDLTENYRESSIRETKAPNDAVLFLGNAYRVNNELEKAIQTYNRYKELLTKDDIVNIEYADKQIVNCRNAMKFMENPIQAEEINLDRPINNSASNFRPAVSGDGKTMVYMNGLPFYDALFYTTFEDGEWNAPINITPQVQSDGDQYVTALSYDGKILLLVRDDGFDSQLYISSLTDGVWSKARRLDKEINTKFWESHASLSKDGNTVYFTSNQKGTVGEMDIFMSVKDAEGDWGSPVNLGNIINTDLNEDAPFITSDNKRLYFSSQGHDNMGGYDIFYSDRNEDGTWSEPVNMGYPINTTDNDLFYCPLDKNTGFMAKFHEAGKGREDIFMYKIGGAPVEVTADIAEPEEEKTEEITAAIKEETEEMEEDLIEKVEAPMVREYTLTPILFSFDESFLTADSKKMLDELVEILKAQPAITIHFFGYTDNEGPDSYNLILGEKRAQAVADYLISKSIKESRIHAEGKGSVNFIARNKNSDGTDNPEGRKFNRRVELEFDNVPKNIVVITPNIVPENLRK